MTRLRKLMLEELEPGARHLAPVEACARLGSTLRVPLRHPGGSQAASRTGLPAGAVLGPMGQSGVSEFPNALKPRCLLIS